MREGIKLTTRSHAIWRAQIADATGPVAHAGRRRNLKGRREALPEKSREGPAVSLEGLLHFEACLLGYVRRLRETLHVCIEEGTWSQWLCEILSPRVIGSSSLQFAKPS